MYINLDSHGCNVMSVPVSTDTCLDTNSYLFRYKRIAQTDIPIMGHFTFPFSPKYSAKVRKTYQKYNMPLLFFFVDKFPSECRANIETMPRQHRVNVEPTPRLHRANPKTTSRLLRKFIPDI